MFKFKLIRFRSEALGIILVLMQFFIVSIHFLKWEFISQKEILQSNFLIKTSSIFIFIFGSIILLMAYRELGNNLSPFPRPKANGNLTTSGIYSIMRHPMYYGLILISLAIFLNKLTIYYLVLTVSLFLIIKLKITIEEKYLNQKYKNYITYKNKVKF